MPAPLLGYSGWATCADTMGAITVHTLQVQVRSSLEARNSFYKYCINFKHTRLNVGFIYQHKLSWISYKILDSVLLSWSFLIYYDGFL